MSSLAKFCKISTRLWPQNGVYTYNIAKYSMIRDYKPAQYPTTEEERAKAAEKYNLIREDYKPIPDDGNGLGDYPELPMVSAEAKDDYYPWDFPEHKRNFNEPMHIWANMLGEDRYYHNPPLRYPMYVYWLTFIGVMGGFVGIFLVCENYKYVQPVVKKQYPSTNKTHYTFESLK
ncbi:NADH dehydrogenase [ubiquinone] 1 beta subcomplex subunit 8, mitochondrial [Neodiprion virginianus]|uniref:NADH dehydrogenase [ubiquinone] 1 beta subcomplex subunit 8, mitochondrial n=1 Tax=Neodiprion virginianus TaxID=2961670 RepID=UPI001EE76BB3|nr:NADH dehydrogenase [ubiquinone] 1 beta subcomplex subunit 8, mitochondrial [Neodiprion virginianus]